MKYLRGTYVHRSDVERRKRRAQAVVMVVGLVTAGAMAAHNWAPIDANAEPVQRTVAQRPEFQLLNERIEKTRSELAMADVQLQRWNRIFSFSRRFQVEAELSAQVYDAAVRAGIDPELAFPLVRLESSFKSTAVSSAGALGLTQLMIPTARFYQKDVT
ncbi:MAG: transglycosylase SLT domain-containing protein, partial [Gemmatimonadaceae bacterium]